MKAPFDFSFFPTLHTQRLILREMTFDDLPQVFALFSDAAVTRHNDVDTFRHSDDAELLLGFIQDRFDNQLGLRWGICLKTDEYRVIGTCGYNIWKKYNRSAKIGYDLMPAYWGQGIMPEALTAIIGFGFQQMHLNRIEADVTLANAASMRVLEKLGFQQEGILRQAGYWKNQFHDLRLYALLQDEYQNETNFK